MKGFCPRTNPYPSGVGHHMPYSKKKMEQEFHKQQQRKMVAHSTDGCVAPPPPYEISLRQFSDTASAPGEILRSQSMSARPTSSGSWSIIQCPNCHHRLQSCVDPMALRASFNGMEDWDDSLPPPICESAPFQELREVIILRPEDEKFGLKFDKIGQGVYITTVVRASPAANAGLKVGDEVIRVNGNPISRFNLSELMDAMRFCETALSLVYRPRSVISKTRRVVLHKDSKLGLRLQRRADGIFIDMVVEMSPAEEAGLKEGDEVLKINSHLMKSMDTDQATVLLKSLPPNSDVTFWIREVFPTAHVDGYTPDICLGRAALDRHGDGNSELKVSDAQSISALSGI